MIKYFFLLILLFGCVNAQSDKHRISFSDKIEQLCKDITESMPERVKIVQSFREIDTKKITQGKDCFPKVVEGFSEDSCYIAPLNLAEREAVPINGGRLLLIYTKKNLSYYEFSMSLKSTYTQDKNKRIHYEIESPFNISYISLMQKFGQPISAKIQAKDTKNYYYIYTNPESQKTAIIEVTSFDPPGLGYNTIYNISVYNKELVSGQT